MKYATDMMGHKLASTYHLVIDGKCAGRIDTCYGSTFAACTATLRIYAGPWACEVSTSRAGGGGYCRESAAVAQALNQTAAFNRYADMHGCGMSAVRKAAEDAGYLWCD